MALRDRVRIEVRTDAAGAALATWGTLATVSANIVGAAGGESARGRQVEEHTQYVVEIRWRSDVTAANRIVVLSGPASGKTLNIAGVKSIDRRQNGGTKWLELQCKD